ncbi:MAG: T9SS type A sorting domain-containing protein [Ferruginibacter sp.]|nr:T9SS type A sorting domain-containing protein [Ferruginibacter sp.]
MRRALLITTVLVLLISIRLSAQEDQPYRHGLSPMRGSFVYKNQVSGLNSNPDVNNSTGNSGTGANLDVIYQRINWTVDPRAGSNTITGNVLIRFKTITPNVSTITFDLNSGSFNNGSLIVTYHGNTIAGRTLSGNILTIPLGATIAASGTVDSVTVAYSGIPPAVSGAAQGYQRAGTSPNQYTTSLSESYEDRDWWPCKADMQDKIDSLDINVTVPWIVNANADTFWVASNGVLYDSTITGNNRTFKFKTRYPIASYLVTLSVGKFTRYYRTAYSNGVPVPTAYYILKNTTNHAAKITAMDKVNIVLDSFSRRFGHYPFKNEKHGFYDGLLGAGGMEHQTFSGMASGSMASLGTLNHELMHQWFGDNVTFATWNDLWLAEGPARYSEYLAASSVPALGYTAASAQTLRTNLKNNALGLNSQSAWIPNANIGNSDLIWLSNYGSTVYERGGMIVSMLRTLAGDAKFFEAMTNYQTALTGKSATTDSLKNHFNAVLKTDISGFFNAYVGGSGGTAAPGNGGLGNNVDTVYWSSPAANRLVLRVGVQTKTNAANTNYFQGPVVVRATAVGKDTTIVFYDWGGGSLSYAGNGLSVPFEGGALNYELSFTPTALIYDDSARTLSTGGTRNISTFKGYIWTGTTSTAWNTASNWMAGVVPPSGAQVTIATSGSNNPVLPGSTTVGKLFLNAGTKLTIGAGNTLTINDAISGTGVITGSATSNIIANGPLGTINMDQTSAATRSLNNFTLGLAASAKLGNAMDVYGTITLNSASLNLNAMNLTLKSNSAGTARIADLTNSTLTGATNVTVERYIKLRSPGTGDGAANYGRAYRLLAPVVNSTGSIRTNWMEGGMNTIIGTNVNPVPGYGIQITGTGGNTNGFDVTQTNAASLYSANNGVTPTYTAITNTTATLNALKGYFAYIRGDRSVSMYVPLGTNMPTTHTTLRATGSLVTGAQTSFANAFVGGGALNLITNPYPSPIDWSLLRAACTNVTNFYTIWDPNIGTRGGFVTVNTSGVPSAGSANKFIQPGQAFFVESSGGVPTVTIAENQKSAGNNNTVFIVAGPPSESFKAGLYFIEDSGYRRQSDGITVLYDNAYSKAVTDEDAKEINNWDENIAVDRENKHLAIESRPVITTRDTIPLFMNNMKQQAYEFEFVPEAFTHIGLKAELIDKYLNTRTLLSVVDTVTVSFTVTADPASSASDRFMVVFGPSFTLAIDALSIKAQAKYMSAAQGGNHVQVDWSAKTEKDMNRYELERSFDGTAFTRIHTTPALGNSSSQVNYSWNDDNPQTGSNFYRIKAIDNAGLTKYTAVVKVDFGKSTPGMAVHPNPVTGNSFSLQLTDVEKGSYGLTIINSLGQTVYSTQLQHGGGVAVIPVSPGKLAKGLYEILLKGENELISTRIIKN